MRPPCTHPPCTQQRWPQHPGPIISTTCPAGAGCVGVGAPSRAKDGPGAVHTRRRPWFDPGHLVDRARAADPGTAPAGPGAPVRPVKRLALSRARRLVGRVRAGRARHGVGARPWAPSAMAMCADTHAAPAGSAATVLTPSWRAHPPPPRDQPEPGSGRPGPACLHCGGAAGAEAARRRGGAASHRPRPPDFLCPAPRQPALYPARPSAKVSAPCQAVGSLPACRPPPACACLRAAAGAPRPP